MTLLIKRVKEYLNIVLVYVASDRYTLSQIIDTYNNMYQYIIFYLPQVIVPILFMKLLISFSFSLAKEIIYNDVASTK